MDSIVFPSFREKLTEFEKQSQIAPMAKTTVDLLLELKLVDPGTVSFMDWMDWSTAHKLHYRRMLPFIDNYLDLVVNTEAVDKDMQEVCHLYRTTEAETTFQIFSNVLQDLIQWYGRRWVYGDPPQFLYDTKLPSGRIISCVISAGVIQPKTINVQELNQRVYHPSWTI